MRKWAAFWALGVIWGSSYLLIRIAVDEAPPFQLVFIRTAIAAIGMNLVLALQGKHLPFDLRGLFPLVVLGVGNTLLPFGLITWGEISIDSGLASLLQATTPLFAVVIAHFTFSDERISQQKVIGLVLGFVGVVVLMSGSWSGEAIATSSLLGQLAVVGASVCYGVFGAYSRRLMQGRYDPLTLSAGAMTFCAAASGVVLLIAPVLGQQAAADPATFSSDTWFSLITLGLFNTFLAYLLFYWTLREMGSGRMSMVTYVIPVVGLALGAVVLNEVVDARLLIGAALIFAGIGAASLKILGRRAVRAA